MSNTKANNVWEQELSKLATVSNKVRLPKSGFKSRKDKRQCMKAIQYLGFIKVKETPKSLVYVVPQTDGNNRVIPVKPTDK